jgi:hypothetical protein
MMVIRERIAAPIRHQTASNTVVTITTVVPVQGLLTFLLVLALHGYKNLNYCPTPLKPMMLLVLQLIFTKMYFLLVLIKPMELMRILERHIFMLRLP